MAHPIVNGKQTGFTYIGLLVGVAIMGAALAAVGTVWHTVVQREHEQDLLFIGDQFRSALNRYFLLNQRYPTRLESLIQDDSTLVVTRHLRKIYFDPITHQADWGTVKLPDGQIVGVYSLSEDAPLKTKGFRPRDAGFNDKKKYSEWLFLSDVKTALPGAVPTNVPPLTQNPVKF